MSSTIRGRILRATILRARMRARAAILALGFAALSCSSPSNEGAPRCPSGHATAPEHAARITTRLTSVAEGRALASHLGTHVMCFSPGGLGVITAEHQLLLDSALDEGESAARVGHLLVHARDGLPLQDDAGDDCEIRIARALDREAIAHVVEVRLQAALGVTPRHFAFDFAPEVLVADDPHAIALVRRYLELHPMGAPGIDGLASAYRERCAEGG